MLYTYKLHQIIFNLFDISLKKGNYTNKEKKTQQIKQF